MYVSAQNFFSHCYLHSNTAECRLLNVTLSVNSGAMCLFSNSLHLRTTACLCIWDLNLIWKGWFTHLATPCRECYAETRKRLKPSWNTFWRTNDMLDLLQSPQNRKSLCYTCFIHDTHCTFILQFKAIEKDPAISTEMSNVSRLEIRRRYLSEQ